MVGEAAIVGGILGFFLGLILPRGQGGFDHVVRNALLGTIVGAVVAALWAAESTGALR